MFLVDLYIAIVIPVKDVYSGAVISGFSRLRWLQKKTILCVVYARNTKLSYERPHQVKYVYVFVDARVTIA